MMSIAAGSISGLGWTHNRVLSASSETRRFAPRGGRMRPPLHFLGALDNPLRFLLGYYMQAHEIR
jgi:hypothetical protein